MSQNFGRSAAALAGDRSRESWVSLGIALAVLAAWASWLIGAEVPLYEVPVAARLEAGQAPHPLQAPGDGRIAETFLEAGRAVEAGEVLVRFEAASEQAFRREAEARLGQPRPRGGGAAGGAAFRAAGGRRAGGGDGGGARHGAGAAGRGRGDRALSRR